MGLTAIVSGASTNQFPLRSVIGLGIGSLFVSVALIFLLGYLDLYRSLEETDKQHLNALTAVTLPLVAVFAAIVLFQTILVLTQP